MNVLVWGINRGASVPNPSMNLLVAQMRSCKSHPQSIGCVFCGWHELLTLQLEVVSNAKCSGWVVGHRAFSSRWGGIRSFQRTK